MTGATYKAIYGKLAGDTTLNTLLASPPTGYSKSIFYDVAPKGSAGPYVVFRKQAGTPDYALSARAFDNEVWLVKGVARGDTGDALEKTQSIAQRLDALLTDSTPQISGGTALYFRRISDVDYSEVVDGTIYRHAGAEFRLIYV